MRRELVVDHRIAAIAKRQGGVVARGQLRELGLSPSAIDRRVRAGRLHLVHRGVYAVGHRLIGARGRRWAAVLTCGKGAVLSHGDAGAEWELRRSRGGAVHVTVGPSGRAARRGIVAHRNGPLPGDEFTTLEGMPITTPARTLLDLAASGLRGRALEAAVDVAERRRLVDFADLRELLAR